MEGVKLVECKLTPQEKEFFELVRAEKLDFGRVTYHVYYQHGKITRIERERVIESKLIKAR